LATNSLLLTSTDFFGWRFLFTLSIGS